MMLPHGASWAMPEGLRAPLGCAIMRAPLHQKPLQQSAGGQSREYWMNRSTKL